MSKHVRFIAYLAFAALGSFSVGCSTKSNNARPNIQIGSDVYLHGGSEAAIVAIDLESLREFENLQAAKDKFGIEQMGLSSKIFLVPNRTKVLVIDKPTVGACKVRILEGEHINEAVWTDEAWMVDK